MNKPEFAFFDLDGVLLDSERLKAQAHVFATSSVTGTQRSPHDYDSVMGRSQKEVSQYFLNKVIADDSELNRYNQLFFGEYRRLLNTSLREMPGALTLLQSLANSKIGIGVVTSSPRELAERSVSALNLKRYIGFMVCSEDVVNLKPSPDPYALAIAKSGSPAFRAIAIDDTVSGITSARKAGLITIGLRHNHNAAQELGANYYIQHLLELPHLWQLQQVPTSR